MSAAPSPTWRSSLKSGELHCFKVPSTPSRPGASILGGVDEIQETLQLQGATWRGTVHTHSSTVATNALIERKGSRIGLLVSSGFRDLFELQRLAVPHPMRFDSRRPQPLIPRALVREVAGRLDADGEEVEPLDLAAVVQAARELQRCRCRDRDRRVAAQLPQPDA